MRALGLLPLLAMATACIQSALVPCGELSCPVGDTCVHGELCATGDQLAACKDLIEGDGCSYAAIAGRCRWAVCIAEGCGNRVLDPGELCDDGNRRDGDRCSGDCLSDETCGNGITDRALGEDCDCGADEASRAAGCQMANSDDPSAECSTACRGRCGDGDIRGIEQCDGTNLAGLACTDVGFYRGTLGCSHACVFDTTSCAGRCGDLATDLGYEVCDGSPPIGGCVAAGYDAGEAACTLGCSVSTTYCTRFGWRQLEAVPVMGVWAVGDGTLAIDDFGRAWVRTADGIKHDAPNGVVWLAATGAGDTGYAITDTMIATWNGTAWSTRPAALSNVEEAWADATTLWVVNGGQLSTWNGTAWTSEAAPVSQARYVTGSATTICISSFTEISCRPRAGSTWTQLPNVSGVIRGLTIDGSDALWAATTTGLYLHSSAVWVLQDSSPAVAVAASPRGGVIVRSAFQTTWLIPRPGRLVRHSLGAIGAASGTPYFLVATAGDVIAGGRDGVYRMTTSDWISASPGFPGSIHVFATGERTFDQGGLSSDGLTYTLEPIALPGGGGSTSILENQIGGTYVEDGVLKEVTEFGIYYRTSPGHWAEEDTTVSYAGLRVTNGRLLVTIGDWQSTDTQHDVGELHGAPVTFMLGLPVAIGIDAGGALYAAYDMIVYRYDSGAGMWLPQLTMASAIGDMYVAPNGDIVAISGTQIAHRKGGVVLPEVTMPTTLTAVEGTAGDDIFVTSSAPGAGSTGLAWYDGTTWSPVQLPSTPIGPVRDVAVDRDVLIYVDGAGLHEVTRLGTWPRP